MVLSSLYLFAFLREHPYSLPLSLSLSLSPSLSPSLSHMVISKTHISLLLSLSLSSPKQTCKSKDTHFCTRTLYHSISRYQMVNWSFQRILTYLLKKGKASLYSLPPILLFEFCCFACVKLTTYHLVWSNSNQRNRRSAIQ